MLRKQRGEDKILQDSGEENWKTETSLKAGVNWRIIFKMGLKYYGKVWAGSGQGQAASSCEHGYELEASTNCGKFLTNTNTVSFPMGEWVTYTLNLPEEINAKEDWLGLQVPFCASTVYIGNVNWPAASTTTVIHNISESHMIQRPAVMMEFINLVIM